MNRIEALERSWMKKTVPSFSVGDLVRVHVRVIEGEKQRVQPFEGVVIGRRGTRHREMVTVRRVSFGIGIERVFPLHSPFVERIDLVRSGKVRRAKLFYLRQLSGRAAKIAERETVSSPTAQPAVANGESSLEVVGEGVVPPKKSKAGGKVRAKVGEPSAS
jgi:large subunit ribosomal protein L19